jgi:hypothetical protein
MATHRSLNKLEFKAHMSIHNFTDVAEGETHESRNKTRDRFGKDHSLTEQDGSLRLNFRRKKAVFALALLTAAAFPAFAESSPKLARSTDIKVESEDTANDWLNQKYNEDSPDFSIPIDSNTSLGFNEDGDPAVGTRF